MDRTLAREIIGCLQVSGSPNSYIDRLQSYRPRDWKHTLEWLDDSGLALPFWNWLKDMGGENAVPPELGTQLARNFEDHCLRVAEMAVEFESINRCLEGAGLRYAVLKGFTLIPEYCPAASLRTAYDYDYLLPAGSEERAERALEALGYVRKEDSVDHPVVYFHKARHPRRPLAHDDLYSAGFARTVELHYRFWEAELLKIHLDLPENPLSHIRPRHIPPAQLDLLCPSRPGNGLRFYALSEEDELVFQVLHAFRHILQNWCRLCSLLDIAYFLEHRSTDAAFWVRFTRRIACSQPLREIVGIVFMLSARLFGATIPASVAAENTKNLRSPLMLWIEHYGYELAVNNFSDGKFSLFLHHEFVQDEKAWREIRRSSLFPLHRPARTEGSPGATSLRRWAASWKQWRYIAKRLKHHIVAAARYGLESRRWERIRSGGM